MTAVPVVPLHGRWAWDLRGEGRAVRVSTHREAGLLNLSIWREDTCVGTVRLLPEDAAGLVTGLTDGLAALAAPSQAARSRRMHELELRMARLESQVRAPLWRRGLSGVRNRVRSGRGRRSGR
jgi:hypothetical protein